MIKIVEKSKIWFAISIIIIAVGLMFAVTKGLNFGIDFKGGTVVTLEMGKDVTDDDKKQIDEIIAKYTDLSNRTVRMVEKTQYEIAIRSGAIEEEKIGALHKEIKEEFKLDDNYLVSENNIGAAVGKELTQKAWISVIIATIAMLIYIAIRFEIKFGAASIIALVHDMLITLSVYAILGIQINSPFIAAMLTILGYSINDTIVVFDRIRENRKKNVHLDTNTLVNKSIQQTLGRSINTSLSTLFTILALFVVVPSIREFTLPLIVGVLSGSYSSIFIASPVWVMLQKKGKPAKV